MSEEKQSSEAAWSEVGEQFRTLGETIAQAVRAAWDREETREQMAGLQAGLEGLVTNVERAISDFGDSTEGQRIREESKKAASSARAAGEKAWQDAQPHIVSALQKVNEEFRKVASNIQGSGQHDDAPSAAGEQPAD